MNEVIHQMSIFPQMPDSAGPNESQAPPDWVDDVPQIIYDVTLVGYPFHRESPDVVGPDVVWQTRRVEIASARLAGLGVGEFIARPESLGVPVDDYPTADLYEYADTYEPADVVIVLSTVRKHGSSKRRLVNMEEEYEDRGAKPGFRLKPKRPDRDWGGFFTTSLGK